MNWARLADVLGSILGIYVCFLCQGVCQESIYKLTLNTSGSWGVTNSSKFKYPLFLVSLMCAMSTIFGFIITEFESLPSKVRPALRDLLAITEQLNGRGRVWWSRLETHNETTEATTSSETDALAHAVTEKATRRQMLIQGFYVSLSYMGAMVATNFALTRVYYPMQVIVKSAKAIPVIVGGYVFFGKTYHYSDYLTVLCVTLSLILFQAGSLMSGTNDAGATWAGFTALLCALLFDGMTGPRQDKMVENFKISVGDLMIVINIFAAPLAWILSSVFEGSSPYIVLLNNMYKLVPRVCMFLLCGSFGQIFIVRILRSLGALHLTLITTTRKFFGILISVTLYGHKLTSIQWFSIFLLFSSGFFKYLLKEKSPSSTHKPTDPREVVELQSLKKDVLTKVHSSEVQQIAHVR